MYIIKSRKYSKTSPTDNFYTAIYNYNLSKTLLQLPITACVQKKIHLFQLIAIIF